MKTETGCWVWTAGVPGNLHVQTFTPPTAALLIHLNVKNQLLGSLFGALNLPPSY